MKNNLTHKSVQFGGKKGKLNRLWSFSGWGECWSGDEGEATAEQVLLAQHGVSEGAVPQGCDSRAGRRDVEGSRTACVQPPLLTGVVNNC